MGDRQPEMVPLGNVAGANARREGRLREAAVVEHASDRVDSYGSDGGSSEVATPVCGPLGIGRKTPASPGNRSSWPEEEAHRAPWGRPTQLSAYRAVA